ncbi:MAG: glycosyltransferase, partial [Gammaproteobacteria bacterium]|nr:glycosyltransferase [Gammaproteobacteria bacterium]
MSTPKVSLIILTYNWPDALLCILKALNDQTCLDFEVIVADDG